MKKIGVAVIMVLVGLVLTGMLYGLHNDFPIGVYSCPKSSNYATLMEKADSAHFNLFGMSHNQIGENYFCDALYYADNMEIDVRISDDIPVDDGGSQKAARCNYFWYDAENSCNDGLEQYFNECHDYWYYGVRSENNNTGSVNVDELDPYSHNMKYAWKCSENAGNSAGLAAEFLKFKNENYQGNHNYNTLQICYSYGSDTNSSGELRINRFYFDFVMKFDTTGCVYNPTTEVCTLQVMIQDTLGNYLPLTLHPEDGADYNTVLTEGNFVNIPDSVKFPRYNYYSFYTDWDEFPASTRTESGRIYYLFFQVYWNGVGDLYIDGFRIQDNFYKDLKNGIYDTAITNRIDDLYDYNNVGLYGYDEPQAPQLIPIKEFLYNEK